MIKRQYGLFREHIQKQLYLIFKKISKQGNSRELTNKETELLLYQALDNKWRENWSINHEEAIESLHQSLTNLNESQMKLLTLRYWEGLSIRQMAKLLNKPTTTIYREIQNCLEILRQNLRKS